MKKNAMLKIAAVLLVAVLLTTCAISSTFAKYVTDMGEHKESTRVARWGVTVNTVLDNSKSLFATSYNDGYVLSDEDANLDDVIDNVIAPGTSGEYKIDLTITGKPEVALKVILKDAEGNTTAQKFLTTSGADLQHVEWFVDNTSVGKGDAGVAQVNTKISALAGMTYTPADNAKLNEARSLTIRWEWDFEDNTDQNYDKTDTSYSDQTADSYKTNMIAFHIEGAIEQVDAP